MKKYLQKLGRAAYRASLYKVDTKIKNKVLLKFSYLLKKNASKILRQNNKDMKPCIWGKFTNFIKTDRKIIDNWIRIRLLRGDNFC